MKRARNLADKYQVVMRHVDGEWFGHALELPGTMSDGSNPTTCIKNVKEAMALTLVSMIEDGEPLPPPADSNIRTQQVNIKLTAEERLRLETAAKQQGYRGLSDYVRSAALAQAH